MIEFSVNEAISEEVVLVTIVMPAYNAVPYLSDSVRSVLAQDYTQFELLIVDDGSTDETAQLAQGFAVQDDRVRVIHQPNGGVARARNTGIEQARGSAIAFLDADDLWNPETLGLWVYTLTHLPETVGVVYAWSLDIDESNQLTGGFHAARVVGPVLPTLVAHNFLGNASATIVRTVAVQSVGGYDPSFRDRGAQGCEDWDFYLKLAQQWEFAVVPQFLVRYRKPSLSMSRDYDQMARSQQGILQSLRQRVPGLPRWLYALSKSSLYIHFGHLAAASGDRQTAQKWAKKAWRCDRLSPLLRPGWYRLRWGLSRSKLANAESSTTNPMGQHPSAIAIFLKVGLSSVLQWVLTLLISPGYLGKL